MRLKVGTMKGNWEIAGEPRAGGNARVYPVRSISDASEAALKVLHRNSQESINRFRREVATVRRLKNHENENLIRILDVSEDDADIWYVMEWISGGSLHEDRKRFIGNLRMSMDLLRAATRGVAVLHSKGIIHRDLKPDNILLREPAVPVISDLGLCWLTDFSTERLTPEERATGAWGFRAPEHEHQRVEQVDETADIFSLVKILWWLIDGGPPFASAHYQEERFNLARKFNDVRMHSVMVLMAKVIVPDPKRRSIRTAQQLESELETILAKLESPSSGRVPAMMTKHFAEHDRAEQAMIEHQEKELKIGAAFPALRVRWRAALDQVLAEALAEAEGAGRKLKVKIIDQKANILRQMPDCLGFQLERAQVVIQFGMAQIVGSGRVVVHSINVKVKMHDQDCSKRFAFCGNLQLRLAGAESVFIRQGDKTETPLDPKAFWVDVLAQLLEYV